jgi:hypothetical protein
VEQDEISEPGVEASIRFTLSVAAVKYVRVTESELAGL